VARLPWYGLSIGSSARAMGWVTVKTIVEVKQRIREAEHDFVNLWSGAGEQGRGARTWHGGGTEPRVEKE
jgi:hypothetical protein